MNVGLCVILFGVNMLPEKETRLLHLARQFAEVHIGDGDVLGRMARELLSLIDSERPDICVMPEDEG